MWLYDYNIKKSTLLTSLQSLLYSKKIFVENVDSQQITASFLEKNPGFFPKVQFFGISDQLLCKRPSQTRTPKGVTKSCSTLF